MSSRVNLLATIFVVWFCGVASALPQTEQKENLDELDRVRLTINLTDADLDTLHRSGALRVEVHEFFKHKVASILVQHVDSYLQEKVRVGGEIRTKDDRASVLVNDMMIDRIRFQPLEFRTFEKDFSAVEIRQTENTGVVFDESSDLKDLTLEQYQIRIGNRKAFSARISRLNKIKLENSLGKFEIPWEQIQTIRFTEPGSTQVRLNLNDGSEFSGVLELNALDVKTGWGTMTIPAEDLGSISR